MVQIHELEVTVGDMIQIGETVLTVIDIDHGDVTFRIDDGDGRDPSGLPSYDFDFSNMSIPR
jgi:hypothetical protein